MTKMLVKMFVLCLTIIGGSIGVWFAEKRFSANVQVEKLEAQNKKLEEDKKQLETFIVRLSSEKRVAEVIVTDQKVVDGIVTKTTIIFSELDRKGNSLPGKTFTIDGDELHINALVIKFDRELVGNNDSLRSHSLALFYRLFGAKQTPEKGFSLDQPGDVPQFYQVTGLEETQLAKQIAFEKELWKNFWKMTDDAEYRKLNGVRVANGQGIFQQKVRPDRLYTIKLDADGGLNYDSQPLKGIYREAIKSTSSRTE